MTINWKRELVVFRHIEPVLVEERSLFSVFTDFRPMRADRQIPSGGKNLASYHITVEADVVETVVLFFVGIRNFRRSHLLLMFWSWLHFSFVCWSCRMLPVLWCVRGKNISALTTVEADLFPLLFKGSHLWRFFNEPRRQDSPLGQWPVFIFGKHYSVVIYSICATQDKQL